LELQTEELFLMVTVDEENHKDGMVDDNDVNGDDGAWREETE